MSGRRESRIQAILENRLLYIILAVAIPILLALPPSLGGIGLPSYARGDVFHTATIAYYLETARLIDAHGWWTSNWCLCYQDLTRFYPPIGNLILALLIRVAGPTGLEAGIAYSLAIGLLSSSLIYLGLVASRGSKLTSILLGLAPLLLHSYLVTIAVYWEYTRILGDALAFYTIGVYIKGLRDASKKHLIIAGLLAGLTLLTSLITVVWLAMVILVVTAYEAYRVYLGSGLGTAVLYPLKFLAGVVLVGAAATLWWLTPAMVPYGLSHYTRIRTPLRDKLYMLLAGLTHPLHPSNGAPIVAASILVIGVLMLFLLWRAGESRPLVMGAATLTLVLLHGQGTRYIPYLSLVLLYGIGLASSILYRVSRGGGRIRVWKLSLGPRGIRAVLLAIAVILALQAIANSQAYIGGLHRDTSYLQTDEYKIAEWLAQHEAPGETAYIMYGPRLHGNQWTSYFDPNVRMVLTGYMEGCLLRDVRVFDWAFKATADPNLVLPLMREYNITYLIVDSEWLAQTQPNIIEALEQLNAVKLIPGLDKTLQYSIAYRVNETLLQKITPERTSPCTLLPIEPPHYWTPARILGLAASIIAGILAFKYLRRLA